MKTSEKSASNIILFIDTGGDQSKIAIFRDKNITSEKTLNSYRDLSETLFTEIEKLLKKSQLKLSNLGQIAVNSGPGSYTGLRIGITVANFLAWSLKVPIVAARILNDKLVITGENKQQFILPKYLHPVRITKPELHRKD